MKKKLIKEILEILKLIKNEIKHKEKLKKELYNLNNEINRIEEKIKNIEKKNKKINKVLNISMLNKLQSISLKKNNEMMFIENNLSEYQRQNVQKEIELENYLKLLIGKKNKNEFLITNKKDELFKAYEKIKKNSKNQEEQEHIIIPPELMSICLESKIINEIEFMNNIKNLTHNLKQKNEQFSREIDSNIKTLIALNNKKESSSNAELSTGVKNSSFFSKHNFAFQQMENLNNINLNNINEENESISSISMELETNLNLSQIPSDDESLRFIDKVFDIKSNIKPIKNMLKSVIYPLNAKPSQKLIQKAEPIKIEKPINYRNKGDNINKEIDIIKKEIEIKKNNIIEIQNKKKNLDEEYNKSKSNLIHALMKIKIIKDKIEYIKKQIEDLSANNKKDKFSRILSINNIINNRNYCLINNNDNNSIYDKETFRK